MKNQMKALAISALLAAGCAASVAMAPADRDQQAKQFTAGGEAAHLYVFRDEYSSAEILLPVFVDGTWLGDNAAHSFLYVALPPGRHQLISRLGGNEASVIVDAAAGKNYFVSQSVGMGLLRERTEQMGREGVNDCSLAVGNLSWAPANAQGGCGKDTDCKGNRICRAGSCVEPEPAANGGPAPTRAAPGTN